MLDLATQLFNQDLGKWFDGTASVFWALLGPAIAYLIYFCIGGVIAMAFEETKPLKAIVLGISAPALIASWLSGETPQNTANLDAYFGIQPAFAADVLSNSERDITVVIPEHLKTEDGIKYKLTDLSGKTIEYGVLGGPGERKLKLPDKGTVTFYGNDINPQTLAHPTPHEVYELGLHRNYWNDFFLAN